MFRGTGASSPPFCMTGSAAFAAIPVRRGAGVHEFHVNTAQLILMFLLAVFELRAKKYFFLTTIHTQVQIRWFLSACSELKEHLEYKLLYFRSDSKTWLQATMMKITAGEI